MRKTLHLYPHAGSQNHGCEAIVRTTAELFEKENNLKLYTFKKKRMFFMVFPGKTWNSYQQDSGTIP